MSTQMLRGGRAAPEDRTKADLSTDMVCCSAFIGFATKEDAEERLQTTDVIGAFLIFADLQAKYTLSLKTADVSQPIRHYPLELSNDGKLYLEEDRQFNAIQDLITFYRSDSGYLPAQLTQAVGSDEWEIDPSELQIDEELKKKSRGRWRQHEVFVKQLLDDATESDEEEFLGEARIMKKISDRNVVQLHGVCIRRRPCRIVTEFLREGTLDNFLRIKGPEMLQSDLLDICCQVTAGMKYLESIGVILGYLDLEDCLVGEGMTVKIAKLTGCSLHDNSSIDEATHEDEIAGYGCLLRTVITTTTGYNDVPAQLIRDVLAICTRCENRESLPRPTFAELAEKLRNLVAAYGCAGKRY